MDTRSINLLLVQKNELGSRAIETLLSEARGTHFRIEVAEGVEPALTRLSQGEIDLVLLDLELPEGQGLDNLIMLQLRVPETPVILFSEAEKEALAVDAVLAGAEDYLRRSEFTPRTLGRAIRFAIERHQLRSASQTHAQHLQLSEARFRNLISQNADAILVVNEDQSIRFANPAAEALFGQVRGELVGSRFDHATTPSETTRIEISRNGSGRVYAEVRTVETVWDGQNVRLLTLRNVTAQQHIAEALRSSEARYRLLIESMADGLVQIDNEGQILFLNQKFAEMLEYSREELLGKPIRELVLRAEDVPLVESAPKSSSQGGGEVRELQLCKKNKEALWARVRVMPIASDDGELLGSISIHTDITEYKRAEEAELRQRARVLALADTAAALNSTLDFEQVLERILVNVGRVVPHDAASILLVEGGNARVVRARGYAERGLEQWILGLRYSINSVPTLQRVIVGGEPIVVGNTRTNRDWVRFSETEWVESHIAAPLWVKGEIIGLLALDSAAPDFFDAQHAADLKAFADQAATALENARWLDEAKQRADQLSLLYEAGLALNSVLDPHAQLEFLTRTAMRALNAAQAEFFRYDAIRRELTLELLLGFSDNPPNYPFFAKLTIDSASTVAALTARERQPISLGDVTMDPRYVPLDDGARSGLWVPVEHDNLLLGVLAVFSPEPNAFTPQEERLLQLFGNQAAVALENARLYQAALQAGERRTVLHWASQEIVSAGLDAERAYVAIHQSVSRLMPSEAFVIALLDPESDQINAVYLTDRGGRQPQANFSSTRGLSGYVISTGESLLINDMDLSGRQLDLLNFGYPKRVDSLLAVPLRHGGAVFGMISTQCYHKDAYTAEDRLMLEMLAAHAAAALENVRGHAKTRRLLAQTSRLFETSQALAQAVTLKEAAQKVTQSLCAAFDADSAALVFVDADGHWSFRYRYPVENKEEDEEILPEYDDAARLFMERGILYELAGTQIHKSLQDRGIKKIMALPLRNEKGSVGALFVRFKETRSFGELERQELTIYANQAAVVVGRARQYEETEQRLKELEAVNRISTALRLSQTLDQMLPLLLEETLSVLHTDAGTIWLYDQDTELLQMAVSRGWFTVLDDAPMPANVGIAGRVISTGEPYVIHEFATDPSTREVVRKRIPRGWSGVGIPISAAHQIVGILFVSTRLPREITLYETRLLTTLAEIFGNAMHRMNLHESLEAAYVETALALANAIDARDTYTARHSDRLAEMAVALAEEMGVTEEERHVIRLAARLHDIGKIGVPDTVLRKPGELTEEEWALMRRHPLIGAEILKPVRQLQNVTPIVRHHQEHFDGTGYPEGLRGEEIPLGARILAVVDAYSAMIDDRAYRKGRPPPQAVNELERHAGTQFDPDVVAAFMRTPYVRMEIDAQGELVAPQVRF